MGDIILSTYCGYRESNFVLWQYILHVYNKYRKVSSIWRYVMEDRPLNRSDTVSQIKFTFN